MTKFNCHLISTLQYQHHDPSTDLSRTHCIPTPSSPLPTTHTHHPLLLPRQHNHPIPPHTQILPQPTLQMANPSTSTTTAADASQQPTEFETRRAGLVHQIGDSLEQVLTQINALNRSLEGIIEVGLTSLLGFLCQVILSFVFFDVCCNIWEGLRFNCNNPHVPEYLHHRANLQTNNA